MREMSPEAQTKMIAFVSFLLVLASLDELAFAVLDPRECSHCPGRTAMRYIVVATPFQSRSIRMSTSVK